MKLEEGEGRLTGVGEGGVSRGEDGEGRGRRDDISLRDEVEGQTHGGEVGV